MMRKKGAVPSIERQVTLGKYLAWTHCWLSEVGPLKLGAMVHHALAE